MPITLTAEFHRGAVYTGEIGNLSRVRWLYGLGRPRLPFTDFRAHERAGPTRPVLFCCMPRYRPFIDSLIAH